MAGVCLTIDIRDRTGGGSPPGEAASLIPWAKRVRSDLSECGRLLDELGVAATFFVTGQLAYEAPDALSELAARGHEVGLLGLEDLRLESIRPTEFRARITASQDRLRQAGLPEAHSFRAPGWSLTRRTLWAYEALGDAGIRYSCSSVPHTTLGDRRALPEPHCVRTASGDVVELPLPTVRIFWESVPFTTGRGLTRLPFWLLETCASHRVQGAHPTVFSLQSWELGTERGGWLERARRKRLRKNLRDLLADREVVPVRDLLRDVPSPLPIRLLEDQARQKTFPMLEGAEEVPLTAYN
ncbi:MAG: polysaccharide deacetylase family protein [Planctomycetota bacterium]